MKKTTMPNVRGRTLSSGKTTCFVDYVDVRMDERKRRAVGPRKADAQKKAKEIYDEMMARYVGEPEILRADTTVDDLVESFFRSREGRNAARSIRRYRIFAKHFTDFMSASFPKVHRANEVQRVYIEELLNKLRKDGQEPRTLNAELHFLKMLFMERLSGGLAQGSYITYTNRKQLGPLWTEYTSLPAQVHDDELDGSHVQSHLLIERHEWPHDIGPVQLATRAYLKNS